MKAFSGAAVAVGCFALCSAAYAQSSDGSAKRHSHIQSIDDSIKSPEFPQDPAQWINTGPITLDDVKGKGVVLWYFSEQCPNCRAKWPGLVQMAKLYEGQPVLFIAVNSGVPRAVMEKYAHDSKVTWPILVDTSRAYEMQSGVPQISLQNVMQIRFLTPDGKMHAGDWRDMAGAVAEARKGATWKVAPKDVPLKLVAAWEGVEFGNYRAAGPALKDALKSSDAEMKAAAEKLMAAVQPAIDSLLNDAKNAEEKGNLWEAYNLYSEFPQKFSGFDLPAEAAEAKKKLAADPTIKAALTAQHELERARRLVASGSPAGKRGAAIILQKIVKDSPDSPAGKEAQSILGGSAAK